MKTNLEVAEVTGRFEDIRTKLSFFLIVLFLTLPWIKIHNDPFLLLDIWNRHFVIFGRHFFSHDAPLLFFILISLVFAIILATALWGRIWCGWACPQTVFIAAVYRKIEKWILGSYLKRIQFRDSELNLTKIFKTFLLWFLFLAISYLISHSFVAYFVGADRILQFIQQGPAVHWTLFLVLQVVSVGLAFNFGYFRERFCHHLCPYGRFQNVLLDSNSLGVIYMKHAGEPRKAKDVPVSEQGACVDCGRCVRVCPMKIDIRHGFQLECINCAACIDACDEVMVKVKQPTGLIQFSTADSEPIQYFRFRTVLYAAIIALAVVFLIWQLMSYHNIELELNRARQNAFLVEDKGEFKKVTNHFEGYIKNQRSHVLEVSVSLDSSALQQGFDLTGQSFDGKSIKLKLNPFESRNIHLFVTKSVEKGSNDRDFKILFSTFEVKQTEVNSHSGRESPVVDSDRLKGGLDVQRKSDLEENLTEKSSKKSATVIEKSFKLVGGS